MNVAPDSTALRDAQAVPLRREMVRQQLIERGIRNRRVLRAMLRVPRHWFAPHLSLHGAYCDRAMAIACDQTISQPYMVAHMTELLDPLTGSRVLEVGTGSGYQAAVLLAMGVQLVTIERHRQLADRARDALRAFAPHADCTVIVGDGSQGFPAAAPYDRILVTAGSESLPEPLMQQLADHGRIVAPIGPTSEQMLLRMDRDGTSWCSHTTTPCRFVPLVSAPADDALQL